MGISISLKKVENHVSPTKTSNCSGNSGFRFMIASAISDGKDFSRYVCLGNLNVVSWYLCSFSGLLAFA